MKIDKTNILQFVSINGKIFSRENATISVFDQGFLFGFGVFTTIKVRQGVPLFVEKHINRLYLSLDKLSLQPFELNIPEIHKVIKKNKLIDGGLRITISVSNSVEKTIVIHTFTYDLSFSRVSVITVADNRDELKVLKMTYRVPNIQAIKKAESLGSNDAIFVKNKNLIESTNANIYSLNEKEGIITPPINGGLSGISREVLMQQLPIAEKEIPEDTTNSLILVNSLRVRIIEKINGRGIKQDQKFVDQVLNALDLAELLYIKTFNNEDANHR